MAHTLPLTESCTHISTTIISFSRHTLLEVDSQLCLFGAFLPISQLFSPPPPPNSFKGQFPVPHRSVLMLLWTYIPHLQAAAGKKGKEEDKSGPIFTMVPNGKDLRVKDEKSLKVCM